MDPQPTDTNELTPVGPVPAADGERTPPTPEPEAVPPPAGADLPAAPANEPQKYLDPEDRPPTPPPAQPTKVDANDPVALSQFDTATWLLMLEQQGKIKAALSEYTDLNEQAKAAKKLWEARQEELTKLIDERQEQRGKPVQKTLLDFVRPAEVDATLVPGVASSAEADPHEHLWREVSLAKLTDLGCRPKDIQALNDGVLRNGGNNRPLMTMGDLTDFTGNVGMPAGWENRITDFRGVGPGVATRIGDAASSFWSWWNGTGKDEYITERGLDRGENNAVAGGGGEAAVVAGGDGNPGESGGPADGEAGPAPAAEPGSGDAGLDAIDPAVARDLGLDAGGHDDAEVQPPADGPDVFPLT